MRIRPCSLGLAVTLALACSSESRQAEPDAAQTKATAPQEKAPEPPEGPTVGAPAPALALDSLAGTRVQLPDTKSGRASVLIFGSFS